MVSVGAHPKPQKAPAVAPVVGFEHERPRPVAEEHGAVPVRGAPGAAFLGRRPAGVAEENRPVRLAPREERGVTLRSDQQDAPGGAGADERVADLEARQKPRALHADVDRVRRLEPERASQKAAAARKVVVRRHRREHDEVEVLGAQARVLQGVPRGGQGQDRGGLSAPGEPALGDARALADPLVAGVHQEGQPVVGDHAVRARTPRTRVRLSSGRARSGFYRTRRDSRSFRALLSRPGDLDVPREAVDASGPRVDFHSLGNVDARCVRRPGS